MRRRQSFAHAGRSQVRDTLDSTRGPYTRPHLEPESHCLCPLVRRKSKHLGDDYRNSIFANQRSIETLFDLQQFTQRFASAHGIALPFAIDPQGKLEDAAQTDNEIGTRTGITLTPTIFIVTANSKGAPYIEVRDPQAQLFTSIDQALADTRSAAPAKTAHK